MVTSDDADLALPTTISSRASTQVSIEGGHVGFVEFVAVDIAIDHTSFRTLEFELISPSGAVSHLTTRPTRLGYVYRPLREPFRFGSARHLGEDPAGQWTLRINNWRGEPRERSRSGGSRYTGTGTRPAIRRSPPWEQPQPRSPSRGPPPVTLAHRQSPATTCATSAATWCTGPARGASVAAQGAQAVGVVLVAERVDPEWQRRVIAHGIAHGLLHPGKHTPAANPHGSHRALRTSGKGLRPCVAHRHRRGPSRGTRPLLGGGRALRRPDELVRLQATLLSANDSTSNNARQSRLFGGLPTVQPAPTQEHREDHGHAQP